MNRLMQTDMNRLNSATDQSLQGDQPQPESMFSETANAFRRLMDDHGEENAFQSDGESTTRDFALDTRQETSGSAADSATPKDMARDTWQTEQNLTLQTAPHSIPKDVQLGKQAATDDSPDLAQSTETGTATDDSPDLAQSTEADTANVPDENTLVAMDNPFSRLFSDNMPKISPAPVETVSSSSPADLAEKFIERILVSQPDKNGQEVRLQLSQQSGLHAEVRIVRDLGGALSITMHADDAATFQNLVAAQDRLKATLDAQERGTVRVEVFSRTEQENNDTNRRSRGYLPPEEEA